MTGCTHPRWVNSQQRRRVPVGLLTARERAALGRGVPAPRTWPLPLHCDTCGIPWPGVDLRRAA